MLTPSKTCAPCATHCDHCQIAGSNKCDVCESKYGLTDKQECESCSPNCAQCDKAGAGRCDACDPEYKLSSSSTCVKEFPWLTVSLLLVLLGGGVALWAFCRRSTGAREPNLLTPSAPFTYTPSAEIQLESRPPSDVGRSYAAWQSKHKLGGPLKMTRWFGGGGILGRHLSS